jgi:hypothetical protein
MISAGVFAGMQFGSWKIRHRAAEAKQMHDP